MKFKKNEAGGLQIKILLAMKLTIMLLTVAVFQVSASTFAQRITVKVEKKSLESVLLLIQKQSGYNFLLKAEYLGSAKSVTIDVTDQDVDQVLEQVLDEQPFDYQVNGNIVTLIPKQVQDQGNSIPAKRQRSVSGVVSDSLGAPLQGVTVLVEGTSRGAATDQNGRYQLEADASETLLFRLVGYVPARVEIGQQETVDIQLQAESADLEEVVVVGYGSMKRTNITGAVASVRMEELENAPVSSIDQAMAGKIPGVQISQASGTPGGGVKINIRGSGSIGAGNDPLYVVDGFPVMNISDQNNNLLSTIPSDDIESIEILKDASATAIYGSRGSNGVVLITTKSGQTGQASLSADIYYGVQTVRNESDPGLLNAREWAQFRKESITDLIRFRENREATEADIPEEYRNPEQYGEGTNWFQEITGPAAIQNYNVSIDGGSETIKSRLSLGYFNQGGLVHSTGFERYSATARVNSNVTDKLNVGLNLRPTYIKSNYPFTTMYASDLTASPLTPVYQEDGSFTSMADAPGMLAVPNPLYRLDAMDNNSRRFRGLFDAFAEYEIGLGIKVKSTINVDFLDSKGDTYNPSFIGAQGQYPPRRAVGTYFRSEGLNWLNENTATINRTFGERDEHRIDGLVGFTVQKQYDESGNFTGQDFPDDNVRTLNAAAQITGSTSIGRWSLLSYLARINYGYRDRYIVTAAVRRDGSSRFGEDNRWGNFPSISAAWRISEEPFMRDVAFVDELKIRAGYGFAGNFNIGNYTHVSQIGNDNYVFGGALIGGTAKSNLGNRNLGWERSEQLDVGLDARFFEGRVTFTADYYRRLTQDMLLNVEIPYSSGFSNATVNLGKLENTGWEFDLQTVNTTGELQWTTGFNISFNKNKVLALNADGAAIYSGRTNEGSFTHITQVDRPLGQFFGFVFDGLYTEADIADPDVAKYDGAIPGSVKYRDINGDGNIQSLEDFDIIGSPWPDFVYGLTNTLRYKSMDLMVSAAGSYGGQLMKSYTGYLHNIDGVFNVTRDVLDRYRSPEQPGNGENPTTVGLGLPNVMFRDVSSQIIQDNAYLWIKNISFGYRLPESFGNGAFKNARIYGSVQNAFLFTKYGGDNPEVYHDYNNALTPGIDYMNYPVPRTFTLGVNLTF
ncbi:MAG: TonB-dependent receptor [Sphingobacterium sp.]